MHEHYMGCQTLAENPFHVGAGGGGAGGGGRYSLTNTLLRFLFLPLIGSLLPAGGGGGDLDPGCGRRVSQQGAL